MKLIKITKIFDLLAYFSHKVAYKPPDYLIATRYKPLLCRFEQPSKAAKLQPNF